MDYPDPLEPNIPARLRHFTEAHQVLDQGHVRLVDVMGDDYAVVQAARVSYGKGLSEHKWKQEGEGATCATCRETAALDMLHPKHVDSPGHCKLGDRGLIRYMMRHRHGTPFEMAEAKFHIRMPMDAHRQQIRHRTANVNEYSTRYQPAIDARQETPPDAWRVQARHNKQGSGGFLPEDWGDIFGDEARYGIPEGEEALSPGEYLTSRERELHELCGEIYNERLTFGVAKEQARKDLPLSTFTEYYWKVDLRNLLHYLSLRMDDHAQLEIRSYANVIGQVVAAWAPMTFEAWNDYTFEAYTFSRQELAVLRELLEVHVIDGLCDDVPAEVNRKVVLDHLRPLLDRHGAGSKRERGAFLRMLGFIE